jgi:hypothetical protein
LKLLRLVPALDINLLQTVKSIMRCPSLRWHYNLPVVAAVYFIGDGGYMGLRPPEMNSTDTVAILYGGKMPYILRPIKEDGSYLFVGECYVRGMMRGEIMESLFPRFSDVVLRSKLLAAGGWLADSLPRSADTAFRP